ncbi:MAG: septum formation inhibitor Maf [Bacteroidia bacterium]|nr:septum formation inhibitor Maf [Bacteroidia bacterium]
MKTNILLLCLLLTGFWVIQGCGKASATHPDAAPDNESVTTGGEKPFTYSKEFHDYWYAGTAEISSYQLEQARYGEMRKGDAVLVFVTEDLYLDRQVKADRKEAPSTPILKVNFTKDFITGIYPYHMMMSVFTPTDLNNFPHSLKIATASQEWCGHTYTQLNLRGGKYNVEEHSYFESEGDSERKIDAVWLEDELWTRIRLAPESLPSGEIRIIPSSFASRLRHRPLEPEKALATLTDAQWEGKLARTFSVNYPDGGRTLSITFGLKFPYEIYGWEDTFQSGWGENAKVLTTKATRKGMKMLDYWSRNHNSDQYLRQELGLE